ncbi:hypothetical protein Bca52824_077639 [Brassica carinata]|uniref:ENT domain-containing protein n=1 Tax=Brassica carinata TaxID=52824 RepID=A0A8X7TXG4_BRACI|nr:hypothetical protein Bca52824_077639 [Brassica carinata]
MEDGTPKSLFRSVTMEGLENQKEYIIGQFCRCNAPSGGLVHAVTNRIWDSASVPVTPAIIIGVAATNSVPEAAQKRNNDDANVVGSVASQEAPLDHDSLAGPTVATSPAQASHTEKLFESFLCSIFNGESTLGYSHRRTNSSPSQEEKLRRENTPGLNNNNNNDDFFFLEYRNMSLDELEGNAYYEVLRAFIAESSAISGVRIMIMKDLKNELKIDHDTHVAFEEQIETDTLVQELRGTSLASSEKVTDVKEQKSTSVEGEAPKPRLIVNKKDVLKLQESFNVAPAKIQKKTEASATTTTTPEDLPFPSWGHASPESLVNDCITIRIDSEDYVTFHIKAYDAETEMHQLVTLSSTKELDDPLDWIDIRYFPREDIVWQYQHPGFTTRNCLLKPGQTILNATATARDKTPIKEVGRSATGIPIIKKLDKGKAKVQ